MLIAYTFFHETWFTALCYVSCYLNVIEPGSSLGSYIGWHPDLTWNWRILFVYSLYCQRHRIYLGVVLRDLRQKCREICKSRSHCGKPPCIVARPLWRNLYLSAQGVWIYGSMMVLYLGVIFAIYIRRSLSIQRKYISQVKWQESLQSLEGALHNYY